MMLPNSNFSLTIEEVAAQEGTRKVRSSCVVLEQLEPLNKGRKEIRRQEDAFMQEDATAEE